MSAHTNQTNNAEASADRSYTPAPEQQRAQKFVEIRMRRRDRPDAPQRWEEFRVPYRPNLNIISCLMDIQKNPVTKDGTKTTPSWDMNCLGSLGICTMVIRQVRQSCSALVYN